MWLDDNDNDDDNHNETVLSSMVIDWVHTALQDGTFTTEVWLLVDARSAHLEVVHDCIKEG